jgi:hypothetical protein
MSLPLRMRADMSTEPRKESPIKTIEPRKNARKIK